MSLLQKFQDHIKEQQLFNPKDRLILAVSGGVDSVVLCELCQQAGYDFMIAHCNFRLRGKESERDEAFVRELGKRYQVRVEVKEFKTENYAAVHKLSIQEAARELRYDWFRELVVNLESLVVGPGVAVRLLTAHHADDNAETLLMHFFRGTGLHGLTGIPEKTTHIRRPLLPFPKEALLNFAREHNLQWVEDSSNETSHYTRNYFRNELIPALQKVFPQVKENLQDNISRFKEIEALYKLSVDAIKKKLVREKGSEKHIPVKQLLGYKNRALIYEIIADYGFTEKQIDEVIKLGDSESGHYINAPAGTYRLIRHRHWFIISPVAAEQSENIIIERGAKEIRFWGGTIWLEQTSNVKRETSNVKRETTNEKRQTADGKREMSDVKRETSNVKRETTNVKRETTNEEFLDLAVISFPLLLRKWKPGDYFYPLGMKKKKKIARFLIDLKLSKTEKEKVWVIESNKKICWVVGYRIDDRFKITDNTKEILRLTISSP